MRTAVARPLAAIDSRRNAGRANHVPMSPMRASTRTALASIGSALGLKVEASKSQRPVSMFASGTATGPP
jgi:hypothetical protein